MSLLGLFIIQVFYLYSQLSQSSHPCKADTSLRKTWLAGPYRTEVPLFVCLQALSLRRTATCIAGPEGV